MMLDRNFEYVGFGRRVIAVLVDSIIGFALLPVLIPLSKYSFAHRTIVPEVTYSVIWTAFYIWLIVTFGATPGKMVIKARIVDPNGEFLNWRRALLRMLFPGFLIMINSKLHLHQVMSAAPPDVTAASFWELGQVMRQYGHPYFREIRTVLGFAMWVDVLIVIFNRRKRAIHDFIAGSYVVTKDSLVGYTRAPANPAR